MHAVVLTPAFERQAKSEGMSEDEIQAAASKIAADPLAGDLIVGSGGFRKMRIAGRGKGKSGGYRIVTFFAAKGAPVFLIAVLSKGSRENFSKAEINAMAGMSRSLVASLGPRAVTRRT
jgi:hypothetical protein